MKSPINITTDPQLASDNSIPIHVTGVRRPGRPISDIPQKEKKHSYSVSLSENRREELVKRFGNLTKALDSIQLETTANSPTAYQKWLFNESQGHPVKLANLIVSEVLQQNRAAFEILDMTGDVEYNANTMIKAAKILCEMCGEWTPNYVILPL